MKANEPEMDFNRQRMDAGMPDYSDSDGDDIDALSRDRVPVRSLREGDLDALVRIDAKLTGHERRAYFDSKMREVLGESGIRVSLVAEVDGRAGGFVMARVDYGEFGRTEPAAVIDTLGVDPGLGHHGLGAALLSQLFVNLSALGVEAARTSTNWDDFELLGFLEHNGFRPAQQIVLVKALGGD